MPTEEFNIIKAASSIEVIGADIEQITGDLAALDRIREMLMHQREARVVALAAAANERVPEQAPESVVEPTEPRPAQEPDVTEIPPVSIRMSAFKGRTLWLIGQDRAAHIRVPSPSAGGVLCGIDGKDWRPFAPDLSGYVWTCGACYQVMRAQS
jgi:hypothetical protein